MSFSTMLLVLISLSSLMLGELVGQKIPLYNNKIIKTEKKRLIVPPKKAIIFILTFQVVVLTSYVKDTLAIAKIAVSNSSALLMMVRDAKNYSHVSVSYFSQIGLTVSQSAAFVFTYILLLNKMVFKAKCNVAFLCGIVLYLGTSILTTNRSQLLSYAIYVFLVATIIHYKKNGWKTNGNLKMVLKVLFGVALTLFSFYLAGLFTEKSLHYNNFFDNFANYYSSSIYALDKYMKYPNEFSKNDFFGIYTLSGIYNTIRKAGISIPEPVVALEYIQCGDYLTNIYTPLRRYYQDFGIIGDVFILFILGVIYSRILASNKRKNSSGIIIIISAYLFSPLFFMCIEERFFMNIVTTTTIQIIVFVFILYCVLVGNPLKNNKKWYKRNDKQFTKGNN